MLDNLPMLLTFAILAVTILLFIFSKLRADVVALLSLLALFLSGILTSEQALAGFANSTVIMVAALFVVGEGLSRTGITAWLGQFFMQQAGDSETRLLLVVMIGTALLSIFVSNTGTVAMLMPAVVAAAWRIGGLPSKYLIPMAFTASMGGLLTLISSPPNMVASNALVNAGLGGFGFFEFSIIGVPLTVLAIVYILLLGRRLLPARENTKRLVDLEQSMSQLAQSYQLADRLFRLRVRNGSPLVGKTLAEAALGQTYGISVLAIQHDVQRDLAGASGRQRRQHGLREQLERLQEEGEQPSADTVIEVQDLLLVKGNPEIVAGLTYELGVGVQPIDSEKESLSDLLLSQETGVAELIVTPRSDYAGHTVAEARVAEAFGVQVLSLRRGDKLLARREARLAVGDSLLVRGNWESIARIGEDRDNFVVVGEPEAMARQVVKLNGRSLIAVLTLLGMVVLMAFNIAPAVVATLLAALVLVLTKCVSPEEAYRSISWQTVILIAAMLPMGAALEVTGGAALIANGLVATLGAFPPLVLLAGVFLLSTTLGQVMSNTATTVLLAPIAIEAAQGLSVAPQSLVMMVVLGATAAFMTPIATPVNTLVFVAGGYTWGDYAKVGLPLLLLVMAVSLLIVPLAWPL
ncbi:MAG TPA: SLC13 family permease [Anaerolineae bacterium]|nr:SLC13 family permease [Anaerolineae bacterium]HNU05763.1 SLC13 family permease [Anaerolineae bacterium]